MIKRDISETFGYHSISFSLVFEIKDSFIPGNTVPDRGKSLSFYDKSGMELEFIDDDIDQVVNIMKEFIEEHDHRFEKKEDNNV